MVVTGSANKGALDGNGDGVGESRLSVIILYHVVMLLSCIIVKSKLYMRMNFVFNSALQIETPIRLKGILVLLVVLDIL